jgi:hypothetical protein
MGTAELMAGYTAYTTPKAALQELAATGNQSLTPSLITPDTTSIVTWPISFSISQ